MTRVFLFVSISCLQYVCMYAILHKTGHSHVLGVCRRVASTTKNAVNGVTQAPARVNDHVTVME